MQYPTYLVRHVTEAHRLTARTPDQIFAGLMTAVELQVENMFMETLIEGSLGMRCDKTWKELCKIEILRAEAEKGHNLPIRALIENEIARMEEPFAVKHPDFEIRLFELFLATSGDFEKFKEIVRTALPNTPYQDLEERLNAMTLGM